MTSDAPFPPRKLQLDTIAIHFRDMPLTVSLNGADNVGKTTQIELLPRHYSILLVGSLHDCDEKIRQLVRTDQLSDWWWSSTDEDFVRIIFGGLGRRYWNSLANAEAAIMIYDRGTAMFEAVTVAVIAVKNGFDDLVEARAKLKEILEKNRLHVPREEFAILLRHGTNIEESVKITLDREDKPTDARYHKYQIFLQTELQFQEEHKVYQHTIVINGADTHREVQDRIRGILHARTENCIFTPLLHNLDRIVAFGGLSEAGKSSLAKRLCIHYGAELALNSKIVFFDDEASDKIGKSVYTLPEKEQALFLLHGLEKFSARHYWLKIITIESLHRDTSTMWLKTWLGDKLQIVFVETSTENRFERSLVPHHVLISNDTIKSERGASLIRQSADLVLDNNGTFEDSVRNLVSFVSSEESNSQSNEVAEGKI